MSREHCGTVKCHTRQHSIGQKQRSVRIATLRHPAASRSQVARRRPSTFQRYQTVCGKLGAGSGQMLMGSWRSPSCALLTWPAKEDRSTAWHHAVSSDGSICASVPKTVTLATFLHGSNSGQSTIREPDAACGTIPRSTVRAQSTISLFTGAQRWPSLLGSSRAADQRAKLGAQRLPRGGTVRSISRQYPALHGHSSHLGAVSSESR